MADDNRNDRPRSPTEQPKPVESNRTIQLPSLTADQKSYLNDIRASSATYDRNLLMGGPRNKPAC
jgi:hypothetical protein